MKCEVCGSEMYTIYVDSEHQMVCDNHCESDEINDFIYQWETDPSNCENPIDDILNGNQEIRI